MWIQIMVIRFEKESIKEMPRAAKAKRKTIFLNRLRLGLNAASNFTLSLNRHFFLTQHFAT